MLLVLLAQIGGLLEERVLHGTPHYPLPDGFGNAVELIGDVNHDTVADYGVGAPNGELAGVRGGTISIYSGSNHQLIRIDSLLMPGSGFGAKFCGLGDLDGDGAADYAVTVSHGVGSVYVLSGASGAILYNFPYQFPGDLADIGDMDGDGAHDLLIGSPQRSPLERGQVSLHSGATGQLLGTRHGIVDYGSFGYSIANAGDLDGDGYDEAVIGAPQMPGNQSAPHRSGIVYVYSFARRENLHEFRGQGVESFLGYSVAGGMDVDGDSVPDILAGARGNYDRRRSHSAAVLFSGATGDRLWLESKEDATTHFGWAVALEDVDGDGLGDPIVAAPLEDAVGLNNPGFVHVFLGPDFRLAASFSFSQHFYSDLFGFALCAMGDLDRDGRGELLVGGLGSDRAGVYSFAPFLTTSAGRLSVAAGGRIALRLDFPNSSAGQAYRILASASGRTPHSRLGGILVPLVADNLYFASRHGNVPGFADGWSGVLDAQGDAQALLTPGPGQLHSRAAGKTLYLAAVTGSGPSLEWCSVARSILLEL